MSKAVEFREMDAASNCASVTIKDLDAYSCVVQIDTGKVIKGKTYLFEGFNFMFLAARIGWVRGAQAGLFFKHPIHGDPLSKMHADLSSANGTSVRVYLRSID
uniref:hypothetical protein n=1 Tax=Altererythrobacter segetis TaxID=1104773 RepID=UPI00140DCF6F|nr:hypothetical protein [Altererythrobacter segetis]